MTIMPECRDPRSAWYGHLLAFPLPLSDTMAINEPPAHPHACALLPPPPRMDHKCEEGSKACRNAPLFIGKLEGIQDLVGV